MELIGEKFGSLLVLSKIGQDKNKRNIWLCKCDCGKELQFSTDQLHVKKLLSCGCTKQYKNFVDFKELKRFHWRRIVENAKVRNIPLQVTQEEAYTKIVQQGFKCALTNLPITFALIEKEYRAGNYTASFDRIDNSGGYTIENIQWLHKEVNRLKSNFTEKELLNWSELLLFTYLKKEKPTWDSYFMRLCNLISTRSIDPSTKHGCVITDENHRILSVGYNGPPQGMDDAIIPLTRPEKYNWFIHAEENALLFCYQPIINSTVYVTGRPCVLCLRKLIQKGVKKVVYGNTSSTCINAIDLEASELMVKQSGIQLIHFTETFL